MLSLFSKVSVDNGLKRNLEQREVRGSIILQDNVNDKMLFFFWLSNNTLKMQA